MSAETYRERLERACAAGGLELRVLARDRVTGARPRAVVRFEHGPELASDGASEEDACRAVGEVLGAIAAIAAAVPAPVTINRGFSSRGFKHYEPITTDYGDVVKVYESSAAGAPHLWLAIDATRRTPPPSGTAPELTAHLDVEGTQRLIATLQAGLANHYQHDGAA